MTSLVFPDINVWLAMAFSEHAHHPIAKAWFESLRSDEELIFSRFTQLGLLRILTLASTMGGRVKTQRQAWKIYEDFLRDGNARMAQEPLWVDENFRRLANLNSASPQDWADSYLAAVAEAGDMTLVTFDKALSAKAKGSVLLRGRQAYTVQGAKKRKSMFPSIPCKNPEFEWG